MARALYPDEAMIAAIRRVADELGRTPRGKEYNRLRRKAEPSIAAINVRLGWSEAVRRAKLDPLPLGFRESYVSQEFVAWCPDCGEPRIVGTAYSSAASRYPLVEGRPTKQCRQCVLKERWGTPRELQDRDWLAKAYAEKSTVQIGASLGVAGYVVRHWLILHGIPRRGSREALALHHATKSQLRHYGRNRLMVTGRAPDDQVPGSIKHFGS